MKFSISDISKTETLAKVFMLSAYEACEGITGMSFLQPVHKISIDNILQYCFISQDFQDNSFLLISAGYIADRMMNTSIAYSTQGVVKITDRQPTPYYQGWASQGGYQRIDGSAILQPITKFNTYRELLQYSAASIGVELTLISVAIA